MMLRQPILIMAAAAMLSAQADVTLQRAIRAEALEGNLKGAIALYEKAIAEAKSDRATAAKALIRMAECQEKLGQAEARRSYERVVKEYADQKDAVQVARAKLSGGPSTRTPHARLVLDEARDFTGTVTSDGRLVSFVDRMTRDIGIRDLVSGEVRMVTSKSAGGKDPLGTGETTAIAPDGKRVAFVWDAWDPEAVKQKAFFQLRIVNSDGTGERTLRTSARYIEISSWSADGHWLATCVDVSDRETADPAHVSLFEAATGVERVLRTSSKWFKSNIRFSPDGKWISYQESGDPQRPAAVYVLPTDGSATSEMEVARDARAMGWSPDGKSILFARDRQGASGLYSVPFTGGRVSGPAQPVYSASNIGTLLGITSTGTLLHRLMNRQIDVWIGRLDSRTGLMGAAVEQFPGDNVRSTMNDNGLKFSPDGRQLAWFESPNRLRIRSVTGDQERSVTAAVTEIRRVEWAPDGNSLFVSGTGTDGQRALYRIDAMTGESTMVTTKITSGWQPFAVSRDGKTIYYRTEAGKISALSLESGGERIIHEEFDRVPNLRVSPDGNQLAIRSGGLLGVLDLASGQYKRLYTRGATDHNVMWALAWSEDSQRVMVIARDYRTAACQLWIYPVDGGEPVRRPLTGDMRGLSLTPDGSLAASVRGTTHPQVWVLENFLPAARAGK
jgi:Tol biopolymer transport system component